MTISFPDIKQALDYHKYCPFCDAALTINSAQMVEDFVWQGNQKLSFYLSGGNNEDILTIDPHTNEVEISVFGREITRHMYTGGKSKGRYATNRHPHPRSGTLFQGVRAECEKCFLFMCVWQLCINLTDKVLYNVILNSERVSLEQNGMLYEINNVYSTKQTHFISHLADGSPKESILPLIPLDLKNPEDTLSRIRGLLIFT